MEIPAILCQFFKSSQLVNAVHRLRMIQFDSQRDTEVIR